jgi:hypothetical protein
MVVPPPQPAAAEPKAEAQPPPAESTVRLPSRPPMPAKPQPALKPQAAAASPQAAPPAAPASGAIVPATGKAPGTMQKSVKSAGNVLGDAAARFASLSIGAKLRLLIILLFIIWICGISAPIALITFLDSRIGSVVDRPVEPVGAVQPPDGAPLAVAAPLVDTGNGPARTFYPAVYCVVGPGGAGYYDDTRSGGEAALEQPTGEITCTGSEAKGLT